MRGVDVAALAKADFKVGEAISIGDTTELRDPDEMTMYSGDAANGDEEDAADGDEEDAADGDEEEAESGPESGDKEAESFSGSHSSEEEIKGFGAGHLTSSGDAHEESESEGGTIEVLTWRR